MGHHKHLRTDILDDSAQPDPGGTGVTVDNQSDPPASVTTLVAPGADVSTPGSATLRPITMIQLHVEWDTPGLDQVANDPQGIVLGPVLPVGSMLISAGVYQTEPFDASAHLAIFAYRTADDTQYDTLYVEAYPDSPNSYLVVQDDGNSWDSNLLRQRGIAICRYETQLRVGLVVIAPLAAGGADVCVLVSLAAS